MTIGQNIKKYRKDIKMTQEILARKVGVTQPNIYRWEKDQVTPSIDTIKKVAQALNVSVDGLLFTEKERKELRVTDKELFDRIKDLENLSSKNKETLITLIDAFKNKKQ